MTMFLRAPIFASSTLAWRDEMAYTTQQITEKLQAARAISDRVHAMRRYRINKLCRLAGIGDYNGCSVYNAMNAYNDGRPWREVNYSYLRQAIRLDRMNLLEIRDRFYARMIREWRAAGCP